MIYRTMAAFLAVGALSACMEEPAPTGAALFGQYCVECHGPNARGGEEIGGTYTPDLTTLARRYDGTFPAAYVMSTIDGYARDTTHGPMPIFGELIESPVETWIDDNGTPTPTPAALIALAQYLEGLQEG